MALILQPSKLASRYELATLLNRMGLHGIAVEIGTHRGEFASEFLKRWEGKKLYCVDPYISGYDKTEGDQASTSSDRGADLKAAISALSTVAPGRFQIIRDTSDNASRMEIFRQGVDFVYIDGDHSYEAVSSDLKHWWPLVREGGILAGHDFICPNEKGGGWGQNIQPAVLELQRETGCVVHLIQEYGLPWSFYMVKQ